MKKIAVLTGTRAEYGLLYWTIKAIQASNDFELQLIVTGSHLSPEYGMTIKEIEKDDIAITEKIDMLISADSTQGIAKSMGVLMISLAQAFGRLRPDLLIILGDRFEVLSAASTAVAMNIPIAHLCGGESTEGAIDEQIRHSITKLAHIHFTQTEHYRNNVIKMGEESWRAFNVGALGYENMKKLQLLSKEEITAVLGLSLTMGKILVTYHPVTLESFPLEKQMDNLLSALEGFDGEIIFTYPNADSGGRYIIQRINDYRKTHSNVHIFYSLGQLKYLSLLNIVDVVVGNSSSGIIETSYFNLPTVNIGERQKGRIRTPNIIDSSYDKNDIRAGIERAISHHFKRNILNQRDIYGTGDCSDIILNEIRKCLGKSNLMQKGLVWIEKE